MEAPENAVRVRLERSNDRSHDIVFTGLRDTPSLLRERGLGVPTCLIVTDANVASLHLPTLMDALEDFDSRVRQIVVNPGELSKSFESYGALLDRALERPLDRKTPVLALGGGVVGDLAGFAAATLLRGLPLVQIPTSLVAQVDSAIGGKTGINHPTGKNLIGAFYQPRLVVVDTRLLDTLPEAEWMDGLSEVVKYALIADASFARYLLDNWDGLLSRERDIVQTVVRRCVRIKADVVSRDETEQDIRVILNFGHTFGHALERTAGYQGITHGRGVALGMRAALHLSAVCHPEVDFSVANDLVNRLPITPVDTAVNQLMDAMQSDKKRREDGLRFVILEETGQAAVVDRVGEAEIRSSWKHGLARTTASSNN